MRFPSDRLTRLAVTAFLMVFMVYYFTDLGTLPPSQPLPTREHFLSSSVLLSTDENTINTKHKYYNSNKHSDKYYYQDNSGALHNNNNSKYNNLSIGSSSGSSSSGGGGGGGGSSSSKSNDGGGSGGGNDGQNPLHHQQLYQAQTPKTIADIRPYTVIKNKVYYLDSNATLPLVHAAAAATTAWPHLVKSRKKTRTRKLLTGIPLSEASQLKVIDNSKYSNEDYRFVRSRVPVLVHRAHQVKQACLRTNLINNNSQSVLHVPHLVYDRKHSVVWCPNYKVASTTWMINFLKLAHFNEDNPAIPSNLTDEKRDEYRFSVGFGARHYEVFRQFPSPVTQREKMQWARNSTRVIIVRHPFTSILSAYRDKMIKEVPRPIRFNFRDLQKAIIKQYRPPDSKEKSQFPTFPEFVQHVIDSTANFETSESWKKKVKCWTPYWVQCDVCNIDYNVIMKLETMREDERFLITYSHMEELKKSKSEWRHLEKISSTDAASQYYRQLTTKQITDLYQRYKLDFDLFGYTINSYLPLAIDASTSDMS